MITVSCQNYVRFTGSDHDSSSRTREAPYCQPLITRTIPMDKLIKTGIAGFAAWKWGGGVIGTIVLFLIVYYVLGRM